ncbi:hypothetical protein NQ317_017228 [Molorchus minor]|uniref:HTH CENPB-type domain-containing protein n=1 Tax=Molorchus minor TaxID=1323400 RepID=A0ABQ9JGN3_9CUCU|nr:hypothetical protein NQ317_017228 [Molorchus minor]
MAHVYANNELVDMLLMYGECHQLAAETSRNNNLTPGPDYTIFKYRSGWGNRGKWSKEDMALAIDKVQNGELFLRDAADLYNVPKSTLARRTANKNKTVQNHEKYLGRFRNVFNEPQEQEIVDYILEMESRFFGISYTELRRLAFDFTIIANDIQNPFNSDTKVASKKWLYCFLSRHPNIFLRTPEATL